MRSWDFVNLIWRNLRPKIRRLGESSFWYKFLFSVNQIFQNRIDLFYWLFDQIWLETSSENGLDAWGRRYKIPRLENESDESYKARLLFYRANRKSGLSRKQKAVVLENLLGLQSGIIKIENIRNASWAMGDPIGSPIANSSFEVFGYRVTIDTELSESNRAILVSYINQVNIGGNYPTFTELKPIHPIYSMGGIMGEMQVISQFNEPQKIYQYY